MHKYCYPQTSPAAIDFRPAGSKGAGGLGTQAGHQGQVLRTGHFATMWVVQQPTPQWTNLIRTHNL